MAGKRWAVGLSLVGVTTVILGVIWLLPLERPSAVLRLPGVVEVQEIRLGSKVGGRVSKLSTFEGSLVDPGEPQVAFDAPELEAQRAQCEARLKASEAELEKARNGPRREEKEAATAAVAAAEARVKKLKVGYREEEIRQARSDWASAEADLRLAEEELGRAARLFQKRTIAQGEYDTAQAAYDRARGKAAAARARLDLVTAGSRPEDIAEAESLLAQAQANLNLLKMGTRPEDIAAAQARVEENRGKLREIEASLAETVVRAPTRAVVDVVSVRQGDIVTPNQAIVRVLRADDLWVKVFIPETELGKIRLNQEAVITIDAYPRRKFSGRIMYIATQSEFTPRNVQSIDERRHQVFAVKVRVADPQGIFKSGMAAEVLISLGKARR